MRCYTGFFEERKIVKMTNTELINLVDELTSFPSETEWIEFKMGKGIISDEQIGEYIKQYHP